MSTIQGRIELWVEVSVKASEDDNSWTRKNQSRLNRDVPLPLLFLGFDISRTGADVYPAGYVGVHNLVLRIFDRHRHVGHYESHDRGHAGEVQSGQLGREPPPEAGKDEGGLACVDFELTCLEPGGVVVLAGQPCGLDGDLIMRCKSFRSTPCLAFHVEELHANQYRIPRARVRAHLSGQSRNK